MGARKATVRLQRGIGPVHFFGNYNRLSNQLLNGRSDLIIVGSAGAPRKMKRSVVLRRIHDFTVYFRISYLAVIELTGGYCMGLNRLTNYLSFIASLVILLFLYIEVVDIYDKGPKEYPGHVHKIIYVDRNFDDLEQEHIIMAALKWSEATNHIVEYDVIQLPSKEQIDVTRALFFVKVSADYPDVVIMDNIKKTTTLGYFQNRGPLPYITLIDGRLNEETYEPVVLHELGHSLGLEHVEGPEGYGTLMYPYIDLGSDSITETDLEQFCKLYKCDPKKLKH
jgi:hypothetical protein